MSDLPAAVQMLERDLRGVFGGRLRSLVVYGLRGQEPLHGDDAHLHGAPPTHTLAVVDQLTADDLRACSARVASWHDAGLATRSSASSTTWTDGARRSREGRGPRAEGQGRGNASVLCPLLIALLTGGVLAQDANLPELAGPVRDVAHVIDPANAAAIEQMSGALKAATGDVVVVATVQKLEGKSEKVEGKR